MACGSEQDTCSVSVPFYGTGHRGGCGSADAVTSGPCLSKGAGHPQEPAVWPQGRNLPGPAQHPWDGAPGGLRGPSSPRGPVPPTGRSHAAVLRPAAAGCPGWCDWAT